MSVGENIEEVLLGYVEVEKDVARVARINKCAVRTINESNNRKAPPAVRAIFT